MKYCTVAIALTAAALLAGCSRTNEQGGSAFVPRRFPAALETPAVAFFLEGSTAHDPCGDFLGCGVLACVWANSERRYFVATAAHVLQGAKGPLQIGVKAATCGNKIRRLHVPPGGIEWKQPDLKHDIVVGDITKSMETMRSTGTVIECIDLDSIGATPMVQAECTFTDAGVATSNRYESLGIGLFSHATAVCADIGSTQLVNPATKEWSSPFVRKEATLMATFTSRRHAKLDADGKPTTEPVTLTVNSYLGKIEAGNSGAPVFIRGADGCEYFSGIINGKDDEVFYAVPVDFLREYVEKAYCINPKAVCAEYRSVHIAEYDAMENAVKDVAVTLWKPGVRKLDITIEGDATDSNSFMVYFAKSDSLPCIKDSNDLDVSMGWDNRKTPEAAPGHKRVTVSFFFDPDGNTLYGNADESEKIEVENRGVNVGKNLNMMRMASLGKGCTNGKVRFEQYTLLNGEKL